MEQRGHGAKLAILPKNGMSPADGPTTASPGTRPVFLSNRSFVDLSGRTSTRARLSLHGICVLWYSTLPRFGSVPVKPARAVCGSV